MLSEATAAVLERQLLRFWRLHGSRTVVVLVGLLALVVAASLGREDSNLGHVIAIPLGCGCLLLALLPRRPRDDVRRLFALRSGAQDGVGREADPRLDHEPAPNPSLRSELIPSASEFLEHEAKRTATTRSTAQLVLGVLTLLALLALLLAPWVAYGIVTTAGPLVLHQVAVLAGAGAALPLVLLHRRL